MIKPAHKLELRSLLTKTPSTDPFEGDETVVDNDFDDEDDDRSPTKCRARGTAEPPIALPPPLPRLRPAAHPRLSPRREAAALVPLSPRREAAALAPLSPRREALEFPALTWVTSPPAVVPRGAPTDLPPQCLEPLDSPEPPLSLGSSLGQHLPRPFTSPAPSGFASLALPVMVSASCGSGFVAGAVLGAWADAGALGLLTVFLVTTSSAFALIAFWVWASCWLDKRLRPGHGHWFN